MLLRKSCGSNSLRYIFAPYMRHRLLLQEWFCGLNPPLCMKPSLDNVVVQEICQSQKAQPPMVGHPASHQMMTVLPESAPSRAKICGFIEAVAPHPAQVCHS